MKLTQNQKDLLACIKDKKIRKEVKKEFKKKITFYYTRWKLLDEVEPIVFENGKLETDHPKIQEFLSNHPMCEKNKLTDEFISPEKAIEILAQREKPRVIDPITPFTIDQIETVIDWMNTWEQLKDTAIPIRFKEDFTNKKFEFKGFDSKNYRFSPKGKIGDKLKVEKILPKEDVDTFKKEIQSMISADISHLTFTTELNNGNFVFYKDNHKPFEYSGKISEMTFSDKLAIVEKIESYAEELDVNLKPKGKFIIPK